MIMQPGDKVMIFEDPITQLKPEGTATLVENYKPDIGDGLSIWTVRFEDDGYVTTRTIKPK